MRWRHGQADWYCTEIFYCTTLAFVPWSLCAFKDGYKLKHILAIVADSAGQIQPLKAILNSAIDACGDRQIIRGTKISGSTCLHKQLLTMPRMFWATDDYATMINFGKKQSGRYKGR